MKLRDFRIELGEIEARLRLYPAVREAVVFVWADRPDDGTLQYCRDVFQASTIATLVARFQALLQNLVQQPDIPLDLLEIIPDTECAEVEQERRRLRTNRGVEEEIWFDFPSHL